MKIHYVIEARKRVPVCTPEGRIYAYQGEPRRLGVECDPDELEALKPGTVLVVRSPVGAAPGFLELEVLEEGT